MLAETSKVHYSASFLKMIYPLAGRERHVRTSIRHGATDYIVYYPFNAELTVDNLQNEGGLTTLVRCMQHEHYSPAKLFLLDMMREVAKELRLQ